MLGGFTTCTAMFISGARTGTQNTRKKTWLILKDQKKAYIVCCVAVRGSTFLQIAARPSVAAESRNTIGLTSVFVFVSAWSDFPAANFFFSNTSRHGLWNGPYGVE